MIRQKDSESLLNWLKVDLPVPDRRINRFALVSRGCVPVIWGPPCLVVENWKMDFRSDQEFWLGEEGVRCRSEATSGYGEIFYILEVIPLSMWSVWRAFNLSTYLNLFGGLWAVREASGGVREGSAHKRVRRAVTKRQWSISSASASFVTSLYSRQGGGEKWFFLVCALFWVPRPTLAQTSRP